jgi:hypothetical protein
MKKPDKISLVLIGRIMGFEIPDQVVSGIFIHFVEDFVLVHLQIGLPCKIQVVIGLVRPDSILEIGNESFGFGSVWITIAKRSQQISKK